MIQLAINGGHMSVLDANKVRTDRSIDGDRGKRRSFVVSALKKMLAEGKFRGRDVVSCLTNDELKITSLRLAETENSETERALRNEAVQRFGLDPDKDAIKYVAAGNVRDGDKIKNELILFAADNETVKSHIEMLEEGGLRPVGIDTVPCALFRSFERSLRRQEDRESSHVFADVGSRFTTVVFGRGKEISLVKQIAIGGEDFSQETAARLGVGVNEAEMLRGKLRTERIAKAGAGSPARAHSQVPANNKQELDESTRQVVVDAIGEVAEKLAREISLCFRYYTVAFRGNRVERAVFTGGEAYEGILLNILRQELAVEIEVAQPLKGFDMVNVDLDSDRRGLLCEWAVAVGLSLKGWNTDHIVADEAG
jgi:type IV pilus assembly protein PilM